jgi:ABC-type dipeptide/oligopeptide/nickel transport system ATPase component
MKLTPEQIAKIEDVLTDIEVGETNRAVIIKYDLSDLAQLSNWIAVMRQLGVPVERGKKTIVNKSEMAEFRRWLLQQAADRAGKAG